jgi:hypothetical protein
MGACLGAPGRIAAGALGGAVAGIAAAGAFYVLYLALGSLVSSLAAWIVLWLALALVDHRIVRRAASGFNAVRGLVAAAGSGIGFLGIAMIWFRPSSGYLRDPNDVVHFLLWALAFLPGFAALLSRRPAMVSRALILAIVVWPAAVIGLAAQDGLKSPDFGGALYRLVIQGGPAGAAAALRLDTREADVKVRLEALIARRKALSAALAGESGPRQSLQAAAAASIAAAGIEELASNFAAAVDPAADWAGASAGPLKEASAAEQFLKRDPATPLAPFIYVFLAHRHRAAFELLVASGTLDEQKAAARKYRTFIDRARGAGDPLFAWVADDLERARFVLVDAGKHPREFFPDS